MDISQISLTPINEQKETNVTSSEITISWNIHGNPADTHIINENTQNNPNQRTF